MVVKGIPVKDRTFLCEQRLRDVIKQLPNPSEEWKECDVQKCIRNIQKLRTEDNHLNLVLNLLIRLKSEKKFESPYKILITEIGKRSPIKIILPSSDNLDYKVLDAFLHRKIDLFRDHDAILKLTNAFPIVMKMIRNILAFEKSRFLPSDVSKMQRPLSPLIW